MSLIDYIFYTDSLYKYVKGAVSHTQRKQTKDPQGTRIAAEYIELCIFTKFSDQHGNRKVIVMDPDITLGACKKYLYGLVDIENKSKLIPFYYRLKEDFKNATIRQ